MTDLEQHSLSGIETPPPPPLSPPPRRNPLLALGLSLLFPGLGHFYIGLTVSCWWLLVLEGLMLLDVAVGTGNSHALALIAAPALYCFAMIDAYFSAREWNAGVTRMLVRSNPRIAAILNMLSKGFGYFYLRDYAKGVICFIVIGFVYYRNLVQPTALTLVLSNALQVAIAVDGYRLARQRLLTAHPELAPPQDGSESLIDRANPGGLPPRMASTLFFAFSVLTLVTYGVFSILGSRDIRANGTLDSGPAGLTYRDTAQNIEITVPSNWRFERTNAGSALLRGQGSNIILIERVSLSSVGSLVQADEKAVRRSHPDATVRHPHLVLGGHVAEGFEADFTSKSGLLLHQRFVEVRRGLSVFFLVETWSDPSQQALLSQAEKTARF